MPSRVANCPNCGGQVEFKAGTSLLSVCPYCASAVARVGDDITELEILGQVAPLADLGSPLSLGTSGRYKGKGFTLVGQLQLNYGQGPWNEWYAAFDDGRWGWVAEAQGQVYLTFGKEVSGLPRFSQARAGVRFNVGSQSLLVVEQRRAEFKAAQGELPFAVAPGSHFNYADVQGQGGIFGTIDFGTGDVAESLFLGEALQYGQLFDKSTLREVAAGEAAGSVGLNCPNCGSGVELRAPDDAQRVACGTCGSLLDCSKGNELFLLTAAKRPGPEPLLAVGSVGRFDDKKWTIYGHIERSVSYEGVRYAWQEYLLHGGVQEGYRWLICSEGHWTWVDPVHAGDVAPAGPRGVKLGSETFRHYQSASARIDSLRGEFYWKVAIGERVATHDYIKPPRVLSRENSAEEVSWSLGRYLEPAAVEAAFALKRPLPKPTGVAPHQPNPHASTLKGMIAAGGVFSLLLAAVAVLMMLTSDNKKVLEQSWPVAAPVPASTTPGAPAVPQVGRVVGGQVQSDPFTLSGRTNLALRLTSDVSDAWLFMGGELVDLTTNRLHPFGIQVNYSSGYSAGASWAKGGRTRVVFLGGLPAGEYIIRATPEWSSGGKAPTRFSIEAREDVFIGAHAVALFFFLWLFPLLEAMRYYGFEKRRWAESDHAG